MRYDFKPLYPQVCDSCDRCDCGRPESWRMPLFQCEPCRSGCDCGCSQTVRLENPCCPGECAEVQLSVDSCGNLVICVHRDGHRCGYPSRHKKRC